LDGRLGPVLDQLQHSTNTDLDVEHSTTQLGAVAHSGREHDRHT
jgi:hypothetical protein